VSYVEADDECPSCGSEETYIFQIAGSFFCDECNFFQNVEAVEAGPVESNSP
jgi:hypothetical protein